MDYHIIPPHPELKNIVSHYWVGSWDFHSHAPNELYYVIASSTTEITFAFSGPEKHDELLFSIVQGHTQAPAQIPVLGYYHLVGVSLYSYAIPSLFNMPSFNLNKEFIPLSTFLGNYGHELNDRIATAETAQQRIEILNSYFRSLLKNQRISDTRMIKVIQEVKKHHGNSRIIDLANDSFLSQKQFIRRFKEFSGFNPKTYARIVRLESALKNYPFFSSLTELAHSTGYYDQAHFIREFKELTGFNPKEFWKLSES